MKQTFELIFGALFMRWSPGLALLVFFTITPIFASTLDIDTYRTQVRKTDPSYRGAELQVEGATNAGRVYESLTDMQFIIEAGAYEDKQPTGNPAFQGDESGARSVGVGIQKQFLWGPSLKLTQNYLHYYVYNASPTAIPVPEYYDSFPKIELAVPLWRNLAGSQTEARYEGLKARTESERYFADAELVRAMGQIDLAYYTYAASLEQVEIQREILERSEKLLRWVKNQYGRGLVDKSDMHQAEAAVTLRKIELQTAQDLHAAAAREFNSLRGVKADMVPEKLVTGEIPLDQLILPKDKVRRRKDMLANEAATVVQQQDFIDKREQAKPQLDLMFKAMHTGRDPNYYDAVDKSWSENNDYWFIGVNFSTPLDVPQYIRTRRGLDQLAEAQGFKAQSQARDRVLAWESFVDLGQRLHKQILLLRELDETQNANALAEQTRF
jgi:outer membrane protein TolC